MLTRKEIRPGQADLFPSDTDPAVVTLLARSADAPPEPPRKGDDEKIHIFWRVFGGAILSICALAAITVFNSLQSSISEMRLEIAKLNDLRAESVRKEEFNTRIAASYDRLGTLQAQASAQNATLVSLKADLDAHKERLTKAGAEVEGVRKDLAAIEVVKEKLTALAAEIKVAREDATRAKTETEKNILADQERKALRDAQQRELEKMLKDLQTSLQECQVKLARVEGQQQVKPAEPAKPKDAP